MKASSKFGVEEGGMENTLWQQLGKGGGGKFKELGDSPHEEGM